MQNDRRTTFMVFAALTGLAGLVVVLQGVWAGVFLAHDGSRDEYGSWIDVHARGADVAIVLAGLATVLAFVRLRDARGLWIGGALLTLLLVGESYLGGLIRDDSKDTLTVLHVPLAMAIMALAVWLPVRSAHVRRAATVSA